MRAVAVFSKTKQIKNIDNVPEPHLTSDTDVKVKVLEVGVCGTDRDICAFNYGQAVEGYDYLIPGHEVLAEVIEVGAKVTRVRVGDLTYIMVRRPCQEPTCLPCKLNHQDFCATGKYKERGIKGAHGFLTEFVVDDETYMAPLPKHLRGVGVLVDPITIIAKALQELDNIQRRLPCQLRHHYQNPQGIKHRALVIGAGAVGLTGAMALAKRDYDTFLFSKGTTPEKENIAKSLGVIYIPAETSTAEQVIKQLGGVDFIYEAAGAAGTCLELLPALNINGVMALTGIPGGGGQLPMNSSLIERELVLRNQVIFGSVNASRENCEAAIEDLTDFVRLWPDSVAKLISNHFPMEQYATLASTHSGGIKEVIQIAK